MFIFRILSLQIKKKTKKELNYFYQNLYQTHGEELTLIKNVIFFVSQASSMFISILF